MTMYDEYNHRIPSQKDIQLLCFSHPIMKLSLAFILRTIAGRFYVPRFHRTIRNPITMSILTSTREHNAWHQQGANERVRSWAPPSGADGSLAIQLVRGDPRSVVKVSISETVSAPAQRAQSSRA